MRFHSGQPGCTNNAGIRLNEIIDTNRYCLACKIADGINSDSDAGSNTTRNRTTVEAI